MKYSSIYIKLILGIAGISFSAILVKWAAVDPTVAAFYRLLYAGILLFLIAGINWKSQFRRTNGKWLLPSILAGAFLAIDLVLWHKTIYCLGAGPATFLGNSQIIFVTGYAILLFHEKISSAFIFSTLVIVCGLFLLVPRSTTGVNPNIGFLLGLGVGVTYAGFLICMRYAKEVSPAAYPEILSLAVTMLFGALIIAPYGVWIEKVNFAVWDWKPQYYLLLMGIATQSWIWIKDGLARIPTHQGSLLLLIQPILTTWWGMLFFQEQITIYQIIGITFAIGGMVFYQFKLAFLPSHRELDVKPEGFAE